MTVLHHSRGQIYFSFPCLTSGLLSHVLSLISIALLSSFSLLPYLKLSLQSFSLRLLECVCLPLSSSWGVCLLSLLTQSSAGFWSCYSYFCLTHSVSFLLGRLQIRDRMSVSELQCCRAPWFIAAIWVTHFCTHGHISRLWNAALYDNIQSATCELCLSCCMFLEMENHRGLFLAHRVGVGRRVESKRVKCMLFWLGHQRTRLRAVTRCLQVNIKMPHQWFDTFFAICF